jgi:hypothetical protein
MAQADGPDAAITPEQAVGGVEIVEAVIAVAAVFPFNKGMHPADAVGLNRQFAEGIAADPHPGLAQRQPGRAGAPEPELQVGLAGGEPGPGGSKGLPPLGPGGGAQQGPGQGGPGGQGGRQGPARRRGAGGRSRGGRIHRGSGPAAGGDGAGPGAHRLAG